MPNKIKEIKIDKIEKINLVNFAKPKTLKEYLKNKIEECNELINGLKEEIKKYRKFLKEINNKKTKIYFCEITGIECKRYDNYETCGFRHRGLYFKKFTGGIKNG